MGCSILLQTKNFLKGIDLVSYQRLVPMLMMTQHTFIQQSAISWNIVSNRAHSAADHWGAVTFVGSVLIRDLYVWVICGELMAAGSERKHSRTDTVLIIHHTDIPFETRSLDILLRSKVPRIWSSTPSERSARRLCTSVARTPKLYAVWRDDANFVWFWTKKISV